MLRKRPKNRRGLYGFRDMPLGDIKRYEFSTPNRVYSALQSFMWSRRDYDPRYFIQYGVAVMRIGSRAGITWFNALPAREKIDVFYFQWRYTVQLGLPESGASGDLSNYPV